jgi:DNA polymerase-1
MPTDTASSPTPDPDLHGKTVWAIDTFSRVYQLFHALPEMAAPDGTPVSAVFGFTRDLLDIIEKKKPDYLVCAIDAPGPTFRHQQFAAYKGTRAEMPADLVPQIPLIRRLLEVMGIPCLEMPGFEADDLLATLAVRTVAAGGDCIIATSDKDARQLLGDHVRLLNLRTNAIFGRDELLADWGIRPDQVVDFLSLVGDAVDNVPGVPGIGPKIAAELLTTHDTLDHLLAHADDVAGTKRRENLRLHADTARAGRELIRLHTAVPIEIPWDAGVRHPPDAAALADFLREMGFKSLLAKVLQTPAARPTRAAVSAPPETTPRRRGQQTFLDLDGTGGPREAATAETAASAAAAVQPAVHSAVHECPLDEAALSDLVARLRNSAPIALCGVRQPDAAGRLSSMSPPLGLAVATADIAAWVTAGQLTTSPAFRSLLADPAVPKTGHDLKRHALTLRAVGIELAGVTFDTLLAAYLLEAGERNLGLVEVGRRYGVDPDTMVTTGDDPALNQGAVDLLHLDQPTTAAEAVAACRVTRALAACLPAALAEAGLASLFTNLEMPLAAVLAEMEYRGMRIDLPTLLVLSTEYAAKLATLEAEIHALAGHPFAIASPLQVRAVLFDELGLPVVKRTKTGPSTDAEVLEELAPLHPLPGLLLEHRKYTKLKSTYVDSLPLLVEPTTGRIHTSFNQTVTATGRLSSSDPNLQNIPTRTAEGQQIRAAFLPREPGWRFIAADYSQIELRILAHLSGDEAMRRAFATGEDIHTSTAAAVFGSEPAAVTSAMRRTAKAVNFGILYGQSSFGLAKSLGIPQGEAAAFIAAYFRSFAGAEAFMDDVLDRCRRDGGVTTMLGRRRAISGVRDRPGRRSAAGVFALSLPERTAINTVVQGSAADLIKLAMLGVDRRLKAASTPAHLVLQIHDELLLEAPAAETEAVRQIVVDEMQRAMTLDVPLEVSVHEGGTWAECEK